MKKTFLFFSIVISAGIVHLHATNRESQTPPRPRNLRFSPETKGGESSRQVPVSPSATFKAPSPNPQMPSLLPSLRSSSPPSSPPPLSVIQEEVEGKAEDRPKSPLDQAMERFRKHEAGFHELQRQYFSVRRFLSEETLLDTVDDIYAALQSALSLNQRSLLYAEKMMRTLAAVLGGISRERYAFKELFKRVIFPVKDDFAARTQMQRLFKERFPLLDKDFHFMEYYPVPSKSKSKTKSTRS